MMLLDKAESTSEESPIAQGTSISLTERERERERE
jgi:hypothetical protein